MSKIVVLMGSPRKNGNTDKLANSFIKGAERANHQVTKFSVSETKVNGCIGCNYCMKNEGICVQKDGMQDIYTALSQADTIVFASPVYYFGFSAQIKAIIDRFYALGTKPCPVKSAILLATFGGQSMESDAPAILVNYNILTDYLQWQNKGIISVGDLMEKDDILNHPALIDAETLGASL